MVSFLRLSTLKRAGLGGILLGLLAGSAVAQPTGCSSTYTATGTAAGGSAGLFASYYTGLFQTQSGYSEASATTFFSTRTPTVSRVDATVHFTDQGFGSIGVATNSSGNPISFSARHRGSVYLKTGGTYTFYLTPTMGPICFWARKPPWLPPSPTMPSLKTGLYTPCGPFRAV